MKNLTNQSKQLLILAVLCALCAVSAAVYLIVDIRLSGAQLEEAMRSKVAKDQLAEETVRHGQLLEQTEKQREVLASAFLTSENDGIELLNTIETEAPKAGLVLSDSFIESIVDPNSPDQGEIAMSFSYTGTKDKVYDFSRMLETMPMQARVDLLQILQTEEGWSAQVKLKITIRTP